MKSKISSYFLDLMQKLKQDKKAMLIVTIGLLGLFLITFSDFGANEKQSVSTSNVQSTQTDKELCKQLETLIEEIDGTDNVNVMITFESSTETVYAYDKSESFSDSDSYSSGNKIENEYIIIQNSGDEGGMVIKSIYPKIRGVAIVCIGADNPIVKQKIINTVCALFDISSTKVSVAQASDER